MNNLKGLNEQRNDKLDELESIIGKAKLEVRAMTEEEDAKFKTLEAEIRALDATIEAEERARSIAIKRADVKEPETRAQAAKDFVDFIVGRRTELRGNAELRAGEMSTTLNGNIIPSEFSNDIIRRVTELSGVFSSINKVNSTGNYKQIMAKNQIMANWTPELTEVQISAADFDIVTIGHHKLAATAVLSYELINQAEFSIVDEVIMQMVDAFTLKVEEAIIKGDGNGKPIGLMSGGIDFELAAATAITADELVRVFHELKALFLPNARWIVNRGTLCAVRLLKDANGRYLFHEAELTSGFVGYILGKPVVLSEIMDDNTFLFGDFGRAYKANAHPQMEIQMQNELYSRLLAKGVLGVLSLDGRPVNNEAYVVAKAAD